MAYRLGNFCDKHNIRCRAYNREWLVSKSIYEKHKNIFDVPKGGGYWAWKPLIIKHALQTTHEDVVYLDTSVVVTDETAFQRMLDSTFQISAIASSFRQSEWTKPKCFEAMHCKTLQYTNLMQVWAGVVSAKTSGIKILDEWLKFCLLPDAIADEPPNILFREHRHDQSILTNLLEKYRQPIYHTTDFLDKVTYADVPKPVNMEVM